ncbi:nitrous oxide reductase family maturation protein NosD [uncultured Thiodictyon sp.]|uniref:right-handed parallel beta-helix repeat-containing protein n=1 Tax=uncultured Thiodictyon sp. TaxID=1846217 RepID=UPI0025DC5401|nr:right-handed parallel beta-helix repeat-containing protein [uncultured Thiodictyon sp.]
MIGLKPRCNGPQGRLGLLCVALSLPLATPLTAATIRVDDDNTTTVQQGTVQYPYNSLQIAIDQAANGDTIQVARGTYGNIDNKNKALTLLGGYPGATATDYQAGVGGDFVQQSAMQGGDTIISGGAAQIGVTLTRNTPDAAFFLIFDRLTVSASRKGILCDNAVSWPQAKDVTISNSIIENNGLPGDISLGAGILLCGENATIINNLIRNNQGGRGAGLTTLGSVMNVLIKGNRIENNICYDDHGGGIYLAGTAILEDNLISGNRIDLGYGWGGGVLILGTAKMSRNIITDNYAPTYGGGVFIDEGATAELDHELIYRNRIAVGGYGGAGLAVDNGAPGPSHLTLTNSTVAENVSDNRFGGSGLYIDNVSTATVRNSVFWGNGTDFYVRTGSSLSVTYSLSQQGWSGAGNLSQDPLFANPTTGDFHLRSRAGRYNPATASWVIDAEHSPAIDVGDPSAAFVNEPAPNGARVNLGAFGNTAQASLSDGTPPTHRLTLTNRGGPLGRVVSTPAGILCGTTCSALFVAGTQVVLTASATPGSVFTSWGNACQGRQTDCIVTLSEDRLATATFMTPGKGGWWRAMPWLKQ